MLLGGREPCSIMIVTHNTALEGLPKCATGGIHLAAAELWGGGDPSRKNRLALMLLQTGIDLLVGSSSVRNIGSFRYILISNAIINFMA